MKGEMKYPAVLLTLFYIFGIIAATLALWPKALIVAGIIAAALFVIKIFLRKIDAVIWPVLFFAAGVFTTGNQLTLPADDISRWNMFFLGGPVTVTGTVDSDVGYRSFSPRPKTTFYVRPALLAKEGHCFRVSGRVVVNCFRPTDILYGDKVVFSAKVHLPFEDDTKPSSYSDYLKRNDVYYVATIPKKGIIKIIDHDRGNPAIGVLYKARRFFIARFKRSLSPVEAGFMSALLLGDRSDIPDNIWNMFVYTGTVHVIAISGLHIILIAFVFLTVLRVLHFPRNSQFIFMILLTTAYGFMAGGRDSVARAVLMCVGVFVGKILEREAQSLNTLAVCGLIILSFRPLELFDIGFQLSFLCVLMIVTVASALKKVMLHLRGADSFLGRFLVESLSISIAVWIGIWPLIAYYFEIVTPVSVLANILLVPISSFLIILGLGFMSVTVVPGFGYLAQCFAVCIKVTMAVMVGVDYLFAVIPGGFFFVRGLTLWQIGSYYVISVLLIWGGMIVFHKG